MFPNESPAERRLKYLYDSFIVRDELELQRRAIALGVEMAKRLHLNRKTFRHHRRLRYIQEYQARLHYKKLGAMMHENPAGYLELTMDIAQVQDSLIIPFRPNASANQH